MKRGNIAIQVLTEYRLSQVSHNWVGRLIPLFEKHGYTYASALTGGHLSHTTPNSQSTAASIDNHLILSRYIAGSKFGGYMGQCLACIWPAKRFEAADISTIRVADTVGGWPKLPKPASLGCWGRLMSHKPQKLPLCPWESVESKHNGRFLCINSFIGSC